MQNRRTAATVWIEGKIIGYLSRDNAEILQPEIIRLHRQHDRPVAFRARIVGGWDRGPGDRGHFGVRLYLDPADFGVDLEDLDGEWEEPGAYTGRTRAPRAGPGTVDGIHNTDYVDEVRHLRREGMDEEAERLLLRLVDALEAEAAAEGWGVAPWYCEQLAIIYRKRKDYASEVAILERFSRHKHAPGASPPKLLERLKRARSLRDRG